MADIELVIKIPEEDFESVKRYYEQNQECYALCAYVANGIPLPKEHGDLIDRKELLKQPMDKANYPSNYVKLAPIIVGADEGEGSDYGTESVKCNNVTCQYYYPYFPDYGICRKSSETSVSKER